MATQTLTVVRKYVADTTNWQQALKRIDRSSASTAKSMQRMERRMDGMQRSMKTLGSAAKAFAAGFAGAFSVSAIRGVTQFADTLANTADRVGVSVESLQALRAEAEKVGLSTNATDTALQRFARRLADARKGAGPLAKALEEYGDATTAAVVNQKTVNDSLEEFRKVLGGIEDPAQRVQLSFAAFDSEGVKLGQTLTSFNGTLDETTQKLIQQGRVMREGSVRAAAAMETKFTEVTQRLDTLFKTFVVNVIDGWNQMIRGFNNSDFVGAVSTTQIDNITAQIAKARLELDRLQAASGRNARNNKERIREIKERIEALRAERLALQEQLVTRRQISEIGPPDLGSLPSGGGSSPSGGSIAAPDTTGFSKAADDLREWEQVVIRTLKLNQKQAKRFTQLSSAFDAASKKFGVDRNLLVAMAKQESGFNRVARSVKGAIGVMQLMPPTAKDIARETGIAFNDLVNNASANIEGGAFYIAKRLKQLGGDVTKALAAYNAGIGAVQNYGGVPPFKETRKYIANIIPDYERLSNATGNLSVSTARWSKAQALQNALLQKAQGVIQSVLTPAEQYVAQLAELRVLLKANVLAEEYYVRAVEKASSDYQNATSGAEQYKTAVAGLGETTKAIGQEITNNVQGAFSSWIDSAIEGTFKLQNALRGLLKDLAKLALNNALKELFAGFGGGGGGGGVVKGIIDALFAKGGAFPQLALPRGVYTQPTAFMMPGAGALKRYARGGLLGEAGPEAILPLRRTASGDLGVQGGGTTVQINNYTGEPVRERRRQLGDREIIEVAIGQVTEKIARGGNSLSRSFQQAYPNVRRGRR